MGLDRGVVTALVAALVAPLVAPLVALDRMARRRLLLYSQDSAVNLSPATLAAAAAADAASEKSTKA